MRNIRRVLIVALAAAGVWAATALPAFAAPLMHFHG
jgi:hypothetical protein